MNRFLRTVSVLALAATFSLQAHAGRHGAGFSDDLSIGLSIVAVSPVLLSMAGAYSVEHVAAGSKENSKAVQVRDAQGATNTLELPAELVAKHNIQAGDKLALEPRKSGAILTKDGKPVAYVVKQGNANLSKHEPLAR